MKSTGQGIHTCRSDQPASAPALGAPRRSETELFKMTIVWAWSLDVRRRTVRPVLSARRRATR